jgi:5'-nucleotidase
MEGAINGIRSIALSMAVLLHGAPAHFETGAEWLASRWEFLTTCHLAPETFLNVNVPAVPLARLAGDRVVAMGGRIYEDRVEARHDPWGRPYYWQGGVAVLDGAQPHTDLEAIVDGFVSITPLKLNWTDPTAIPELANKLLKDNKTAV